MTELLMAVHFSPYLNQFIVGNQQPAFQCADMQISTEHIYQAQAPFVPSRHPIVLLSGIKRLPVRIDDFVLLYDLIKQRGHDRLRLTELLLIATSPSWQTGKPGCQQQDKQGKMQQIDVHQ